MLDAFRHGSACPGGFGRQGRRLEALAV